MPFPLLVLTLRRRANSPTIYPSFLHAMVAVLGADPGISRLVGQQIFPLVIPQGEPLPALTYQVISNPHGANLDGRDGTYRARVQFSSYSSDYATRVAVAQAIDDLFSGYQGWLGGPGGTFVTIATIPDVRDAYSPNTDGSDQGTFMATIDVIFHYRR